MSIEQIEINTTEYLVTLEDGSNVQTLEITEGLQLDVLLSEMGLQGPPGPEGTSIDSIVKTSTVGLVDTYTITFSDSSTQTFTVTNGANGSGSVSSVGLSVPTGLTVSNSPITTSGTIAVTYTAGYSIPTTTKQSNWDTAYGWGNHASAGYLTNAAIGSTVQAYDADLTSWAGKTAPSGTVVGTTDTQTLSGKTLNSVVLNDGYTEEVFSISGTTPALSPSNGSIQTWTLTANSTPTAGTWNSGQSITIMIDDGSAYTVNWASMSITWKTNAGVAPTLNTTGYTMIILSKVGSVIYGARVGDA